MDSFMEDSVSLAEEVGHVMHVVHAVEHLRFGSETSGTEDEAPLLTEEEREEDTCECCCKCVLLTLLLSAPH
jgi:hypothetical protein